MKETVKHHLAFLYGEAAAPELEERVEMLARKSRQNRSSSVGATKNELTAAECLFITSGDQVRSTGEPPLATLTNFLSERVARTISAVHILPFYPSSSDDGFSVMDYYSIDPALGTWDDIESLGRN